MGLLANVEEAINLSIARVVDDKIKVIELDVQRIGGDISTLATQMGHLMEGLKNHKEVIEALGSQHHMLISNINGKGTRLAFPQLHRSPLVGPN